MAIPPLKVACLASTKAWIFSNMVPALWNGLPKVRGGALLGDLQEVLQDLCLLGLLRVFGWQVSFKDKSREKLGGYFWF